MALMRWDDDRTSQGKKHHTLRYIHHHASGFRPYNFWSSNNPHLPTNFYQMWRLTIFQKKWSDLGGDLFTQNSLTKTSFCRDSTESGSAQLDLKRKNAQKIRIISTNFLNTYNETTPVRINSYQRYFDWSQKNRRILPVMMAWWFGMVADTAGLIFQFLQFLGPSFGHKRRKLEQRGLCKNEKLKENH